MRQVSEREQVERIQSVRGVCVQCGRITNCEWGYYDSRRDVALALCTSVCMAKWNHRHGLLGGQYIVGNNGEIELANPLYRHEFVCPDCGSEELDDGEMIEKWEECYLMGFTCVECQCYFEGMMRP